MKELTSNHGGFRKGAGRKSAPKGSELFRIMVEPRIAAILNQIPKGHISTFIEIAIMDRWNKGKGVLESDVLAWFQSRQKVVNKLDAIINSDREISIKTQSPK